MNQLTTSGIILSRTDYGEADRILTVLTPDYGKLGLMAKGVRREKSKLAGGIELFSISHISFIRGRGEISTLVSTRLDQHYPNIIKDITRTMLGYELIKLLNKNTEDQPEASYYQLLAASFAALDDVSIPLAITKLWFLAQLLALAGHAPNLATDASGQKLAASASYTFDHEAMAFSPAASGNFTANHIKFLRLGFSGHPPNTLSHVQASTALASELTPLMQTMASSYLRS
jgi:DNA repair protein RecO (recombination protein O)